MRNETLAARLALSLCVAGTAEAKSNGGPRSLLGRIPRIIVLCFLLTWTGLAGAQTTILTEGFEGAFPGSWSVGDSNPSGTTAYWDDVGWDFGGEGAHGGSWKGYCAGIGYGGTASSPTYRDYMTAYMSHSINLSGYSSAQLTFWYKIPSIESGTDRARVYIGSTVVWERSAVTSSWTQVSISLSSYVGGTRTLKFEFYSDYSVTGEGWYLDDIAVTASGLPTVDLAMRNLSVTRPTDASARTFTACSFGIYNYGPALSSGNLLVEYYLSSDTTFGNSDDRKIGDTGFSGVSIGAGSTYNVPLSSTGLSNMVRDWTAVLVGAGNYYVYAKVSCTNATETDPSDNYGRTSSTFLYQHVTAPTRRALLVGINHYDPNYGPGDLPSCVNDANGVRNTLMLGDTLSRWPSANIQTLTDAQATKNAIRAALQNLASQSAAGDLVVFYQSSHGGQNSGTSTYLNTYNADYEDTELGADLALFNSSANVIVVVDACHSGGLFKGEGWPFAQRVRESYRAARGIQLSRMGYPIPMDFGSNIGFMVACNYDETCAAGNPYSVYTKYLLDACTATSADTNTDGEAQFLEIHNYADSHAQLDNPGQDAQSLNDSLLGSLAARTNGHPTQTIQVTWPSAGASWPTGTNGTVTWTCSNFAAPGWVWIYLFKGNVCQGWLKSAPFQNGSNSTTVMLPPDALARTTTQQIAGSDYQIKILWTQNVAVSDFSDYFSVADYRTMRITSPAGGVTWPSGTSRDIIWTVAGNGLPSSGYVWIYLFKGTVCKGWLATKPFQKGSNTKAVVLPPNTPPGTDYRINLLWTQDTAVKCFSQNFTVSAGPTISNITTDASWPSGIAGAVTWTCNSFPSGSRVWIYLFRGSVCKGILGPPYSAPVTNPNGLNTAVVPLPSGLPPGTDYRVNVLWTQDTAVKAFSPSFEVYQGTSGWVLNPQNGHYYRAFTVGMSWTSAKAAAEAMSYSGMQGHLATVTSAQENEWMRTNLSLSIDSRYWIGGRQSPTGQEPAGGWEWITGESWSYTNWGLTQPDDSGGGQDYLLYNHPMGSVGGFWDDNYESTPWGYIVECEP